jgi:hypothetical protein
MVGTAQRDPLEAQWTSRVPRCWYDSSCLAAGTWYELIILYSETWYERYRVAEVPELHLPFASESLLPL